MAQPTERELAVLFTAFALQALLMRAKEGTYEEIAVKALALGRFLAARVEADVPP